MSNEYKKSGVDVTKAGNFVNQLSKLAKDTYTKDVLSGIGGFGSIFDISAAGFSDPLLVSGTDGVGSKLKFAMNYNRLDTIGIDLVAMCVNDILCHGATPLFFLDYIATGKLNIDNGLKIMKGLVAGCKQATCALVGGETAELPTMYNENEYELAGFCVGAVDRMKLLPNSISEGDTILGIASSGIHSNGFSMIKEDIDTNMIDEVLMPTSIYTKNLLPIVDHVNGYAHITGGGLFENIPRIIPAGLGVNINIDNINLPPVFKWIMDGYGTKTGNKVSLNEMLSVFNCGIGMIIVVNEYNVKKMKKFLEKSGETVYTLGDIVKRKKQIEINGTFANLR